ncbi:hypothetical protein SAMN04488543_0549 [Friedmanniella luteola]|uniref:Uncharacterized protein n=1 Tax=Friedmanniella luteola TaxID=546871 RepID=A0A1H1M5K2_9ACTN|nr:hypothetical protein [Friedmanniella luteola]SDR81930.1 hypothetical protein SAMN04488543_0549 [Friedmanniella luteola]
MISTGMRRLLAAFTCLTVLAFVALFVGATRTEQYFAWTIKPATTAAFLGAAYGAGCVMVVLALRSGRWPAVRIPYLAVLLFTVATLLATLLHLDRFHLAAPGAVARAAAWFWLAVYVVVPVAMAVLLVRRRPSPADAVGPSTEGAAPMPSWLRAGLAVQGAVFVLVGLALYVVPRSQAVLWPWPLTPLTGRAVASWLLAFGLAAVLALRVGDLRPLRVIAAAYAVLVVLVLVAVLRFPATLRWGAPATWVFFGLAVLMLVTAAAGLRRRPEPAGVGVGRAA